MGQRTDDGLRYRGRIVALRRGAFSLTELLVVVAIVAVLAGLTLVVISQGRARAQASSCGQGLRSLGQAIALYANDHDERLPHHAATRRRVSIPPNLWVEPRPEAWRDATLRYMSGHASFFCAGDASARATVVENGVRLHKVTSWETAVYGHSSTATPNGDYRFALPEWPPVTIMMFDAMTYPDLGANPEPTSPPFGRHHRLYADGSVSSVPYRQCENVWWQEAWMDSTSPKCEDTLGK